MNERNEFDDFLFGGGAKAFAFDDIGDTCTGTITDLTTQQQTSIEGEKLEWSDGSPRMQMVITLATDERDPANENDDGKRTLYAKGGRFDIASGRGTSMRDAIAEAIKAAKAPGIRVGDRLAVSFTGMGVKRKAGQNAPKLYSAGYEVAAPPAVSLDDLFSKTEQADAAS